MANGYLMNESPFLDINYIGGTTINLNDICIETIAPYVVEILNRLVYFIWLIEIILTIFELYLFFKYKVSKNKDNKLFVFFRMFSSVILYLISFISLYVMNVNNNNVHLFIISHLILFIFTGIRFIIQIRFLGWER